MSDDGIREPVPRRNKKLSNLQTGDMSIGKMLLRSRTPRVGSPRLKVPSETRAKSATPSYNLADEVEADTVLKGRLKHYGLDYPDDADEFEACCYDRDSKWFSRDVKPEFQVEKHLPYNTETHQEQAKYIVQVLVNLYIAIASLDIQGVISITSKDLADLKDDIDDLALKTDLFRLGDEQVHPDNDGGFPEFNEDELYNEDNFISNAGPDVNTTGKITAKSSSVVNVNHWSNELRNCMNFPFPLGLRKRLATVYFYLSLVDGQKIARDLFVRIFEQLVSHDDKGTNFTTLLQESGLILDHKILFSFFTSFFPYPDSDYNRYDLSCKEDLDLFRVLLKLSHYSKPFFNESDETLLKDCMRWLLSSFSPATMSIVLPLITSFIPHHYNKVSKVTDFLPNCYSLWSSVSAHVAVDSHMYEFAGDVAEGAYFKILKEGPTHLSDCGVDFGEFGIFTDSQMTFMFNRLQGQLRANGQIHSYGRVVKPFVYSINGSNFERFFVEFEKLTKAINTYVHPSNSGSWTKPIAKFVHSFVKAYHSRVQVESSKAHKVNFAGYCLNPDCHDKVIRLLTDIIFTGTQNKSSEVTNFYISSIAYLLDIPSTTSNLIYDRILEDIYDFLSDEYVNSKHKAISSLKEFTRVARFFVMHKLYRVHATNLLSMLVARIDTNDLILSSHILNAVVSICSFIPLQNLLAEDQPLTFESHTIPFVQQHFFHLKEHSDEQFVYDEDILSQAFAASTSVISNILKLYVDKLFALVDVELDEGFEFKLNQTTMVMIESMNDDMFSYFAEVFQRMFWENDAFQVKDPNYEIATIVLAALVRHDPSLNKNIADLLIYGIEQEVEKGAGSIRNYSEISQRDVKLVLYLTALNDVLRQSHHAILEIGSKLKDCIKYCLENISNPPLDILVSILVHGSIASLSSTEITRCGLFSDSCNVPKNERWGGLQDDDRKFQPENLNFDWHVPTQPEITFAANFFDSITDFCIEKLEKLMTTVHSNTRYVDDLQKYILVFTHAISGASLLFDPDFNRNKGERADRSSYREKLMLLKHIREKNCDNEELNVDIEQICLDKDESSFYDEFQNDDARDDSDAVVVSDDRSYRFLADDSISEVPSALGTPVSGHRPGDSLINSSLVFRDLDIYSCNYFFGLTPEEKVSHPEYFQVHKTRSKIGLFLHKLFNFFSKNFENNTNLCQVLLHSIKVWFTNVGQDTLFNDDPCAFLDIDFVENIQTLANRNSYFTRTYMAVKANAFHQDRVLLHSTNRFPSRLEIQLLKDVIDLATSVYPGINQLAQGTLAHCMKQLIGSYSVIIRNLMNNIRKTLESKNNAKLEAILRVLMVNKIRKKLLNDYKNVEELFFLLVDCSHVQELKVAMRSCNIMSNLISNLEIPSSVCIVDDRIWAPLYPPDKSVKLQVNAVKIAKDKKRTAYLQTLTSFQNRLLSLLDEDRELNWKVQASVIRLVSKIESNLETVTNKSVIEVLFSQSRTHHPHIVHLVLKSMLSIFNKFLSLSDYRYDVANAYRRSFDPYFIEVLDTSSDKSTVEFKREMHNYDSPSYYIDAKAYAGWMCWGAPLKVIKPCKYVLNLKPAELDVFLKTKELLTKQWVGSITSTLIKDNETHGSFSSGEVSFFILLIVVSCEFGEGPLKLKDLFELCTQYYDRTDKASMIISVELVAAFVCGKKYLDSAACESIDNYLDGFFADCLGHDLNRDSLEVWGTVCWWIPSVIDIRRCKPFCEHFVNITNLLTPSFDEVARQSARLVMLKNILTTLEFRSFHLKYIFDNLVFDHPYDQIRENVARTFAILIQNDSYPSFDNLESLLEANRSNPNGLGLALKIPTERCDREIKRLFESFANEAETIKGLSTAEVLKTRYFYLCSTIFYWITDMAKGPTRILLVPYIADYVLPFLMSLINQKDVCKLAGLDPTKMFLELTSLPVSAKDVELIVAYFCHKNGNVRSSYQIRVQLMCLEYILSAQLLQMSGEVLAVISDYVKLQLFNPDFVEVRLGAAKVLSEIIHHSMKSTDPALKLLLKKFNAGLPRSSWEEKQALSKTSVEVHANVLGIGAIVSAFPYVFPLPSWIPEELSRLSFWARTTGMVGTAAKDIISEFKKVRADTWAFDRTVFNSEELEDLEGVIWRSYYA
ncbi:proteasome activator BLM10 KNAG_0G00920 [Huiozyma naganishii CBS 8797]|uniref:Proteasome activator BLM10 n=1 Tax=Huiozyma naganishii (strain ATCC MYA-139 / BCRC 22969 / CBS 8797 / KCTC 17520 / NBRC 10181 / NCYC 3082 / Yp74L-3) TaxID=1071383 RepID=J7RNL1_HUIN7|nr:hypothetical protein KNAG_0G00920 [Kazachstania naganishii CBS 8797]CCK71148.1 hypothetical protein KNAG_0G00920 [Kazachstania naganishii CBS 8797]